jgi:hypothetical protein
LSSAGTASSEAVLLWRKNGIFLREVADAGVDDVLQDFANYRGQRDGSVVFWAFFVKSENISITPICRDCAIDKRLIE